MRISIVGTGYVGLVSGTGLASIGHDVICVDRDPGRVDDINSGRCPIHEDGLPELLTAARERLRATTDLAGAIADTECTLICVGTPFDGSAIDLRQILAATGEIGDALAGLDRYHTVAVKSTVVPGTTEDAVGPLLEERSGRRVGEDIGLGMNPEFLREGVAVDDFMNPDRIVVGGVDDRSISAIAAMYAPFGDAEVVETSPRTAEMIKYASNALLATLISFSNEVGNLSSTLGIDATDVMAAVHLDRRLSPVQPDGSRVAPGVLTYLEAGCGFGGSCFGKDVRALIQLGIERGEPMTMLRSTVDINDAQPARMIELLRRQIDPIAGTTVAVLGLAFKPGTDDTRESPAFPVIEALLAEGASVAVYDPVAHSESKAILGDRVRFADGMADAVEGVDAVLLMTAWPEFLALPELLAERPDPPCLIDGRRALAKDSVARYEGIGL